MAASVICSFCKTDILPTDTASACTCGDTQAHNSCWNQKFDNKYKDYTPNRFNNHGLLKHGYNEIIGKNVYFHDGMTFPYTENLKMFDGVPTHIQEKISECIL